MLTTKEILARLKRLRTDLGLRQEYMARCLGIDRTTYVRKECGSIPITTEEWIKLAEATGEDPSFFFMPKGDEKEPSEDGGVLLLRLYKALSPEERDELVRGIHLMVKGLRRKTVKKTLERLKSA